MNSPTNPAFQSLSKAQLDAFAVQAALWQKEHRRGTLFGMPLLVLNHLLGPDWVERHLYGSGPLKPPSRHVDFEGNFRAGLKGTYLAEMLYNLQHVNGFSLVLERLAAGEIEAVNSELKVGRILQFKNERFRFVKPQGVLGCDYDIEIDRDQITICCEVKAKLGVQDLTVKSVYNSLEQARKQLPNDRPGVIFFQTPGSPDPLINLAHATAFHDAARKLLIQTSRVIGVVLLTEHEWAHGGYMDAVQLSRVVPNEKSRFQTSAVGNLAIPDSPNVPWTFFSCYFNDYSTGEFSVFSKRNVLVHKGV